MRGVYFLLLLAHTYMLAIAGETIGPNCLIFLGNPRGPWE